MIYEQATFPNPNIPADGSINDHYPYLLVVDGTVEGDDVLIGGPRADGTPYTLS